MEEMIFFGEPVKALGDGKIGGYLVRFSDADSPDLTGDFFTKNTEFFVEDGGKLPVLYDHGFDKVLKRRKIGTGTVKADKVGLWFEAQLALRDEYEKKIYKMAEMDKLGWSSGAAGHLSSRKSAGNANEIVEWGLAEASLTPTPAEPRNSALPLKTYAATKEVSAPVPGPLPARLNKYIDDITDSGKERKALVALMAKESGMSVKAVEEVLAGTLKPTEAKLKGFARALDVDPSALSVSDLGIKTIKAMFEDGLSDNPSVAEMWNAYAAVVKLFADAMVSNKAAGIEFDLDSRVDESTAEYVGRLKAQVKSQIITHVESGSDEPFHLKAIINLSEGDLLSAKHLDIEQHSDLVVSAMKEITARYRANHEARRNQKAGRVLSQRNRTRLLKMLEQIKAAVSDCQTMLDESQPVATDEAKRAAKAKLLRAKLAAKKSGVK
jgi:phage head maturation protease/transcriptional regulator with XRE-family HTH domain